MEEKKAFLWGYAEILKRIRVIEQKIEKYRMSVILPSKPNDGMPRGSQKGDLSEAVDRYLELEDKLKALRREAMQMQADILYAISLLEDEKEQEVLRGRYIDLLQWGEIAEEAGCSLRQTHNLHKKGLIKIQIPSCAHS